jgi:hypothetical protein
MKPVDGFKGFFIETGHKFGIINAELKATGRPEKKRIEAVRFIAGLAPTLKSPDSAFCISPKFRIRRAIQ